MKLTIGHLYPDLLNLYGDRGNIQCLMRRCQWRGIEAETIAFELGDKIDFSRLDIVLLGGGSDREQMLVCEKLKEIQPDFKKYVEDGGSWIHLLAVCIFHRSSPSYSVSICAILRICLSSPENGVFKNVSTILTASPGPTTRPPSARMLASL